LGLQAASEAAVHFPGGVHFIPLAEVSDASLIPSIIAQALGVKDHARQVTIRGLKEYLHDLRSSLLLFFDNFEHMLAAAPVVAELISTAPKLKVLVTSRATLHIYGEHEFPVPSLALPDPQATSLAGLSSNSAVALFVQRATAIKPNFALTEENAQTIANICIRLDGLPLAIELAAARIKLLSLSAMQVRLESSLQLLTGGAKDLPLRQQTLRGAIDWSFNLLNEAEQALFRRVSVFVGGCTLEGVEAVCNTGQDLEVDVLDGMESLVNKSLVQQIESANGDSRFALLDTVREYGLERLAASGEEAATRRAHAAYFLVLAEESAQQVAQASQTEWAAALELDHNNFRSALDWLTRSGNAEWGLRLGAALFQFWDMREHIVEGRDRLGKLLNLPKAARNNTRVRALFSAGVLAGQQGDTAGAATLIGESLAIARELGDKRSIGIALNALAVGARDLHQLDAARALFDESLTVWRELGDLTVVARSLSNLATVVKQQGNFEFARSLYEESLAIFRQLGDSPGMAWSLNYQGDMAHELGDEETARALYEQSLAIFRELGDKWGTAGCLADLGNLARDRGGYGTALARYAESLALFQELGQKRGVARLLDCLACSAAMQSKPERALRLAGAAAAMRRVLSAPLSLAEQHRLEKTLEVARQAVTPAVAAAAWMDGWTKPPDRAIQEAFAEA
jgi:predicted ATPase